MCLFFACAIASSASAQPPTAPPSGSDAGQAAPRKPGKEPPQAMELTVALSGGGADDARTGQYPAAGLHTDGDALLTYVLRAGRATLAVNARSVIRHEAGGTALTPIREQAGLDFSFAGSRNRLRVSQTGTYSPYYQFGAIPNATPSPLAVTAQSHGDFANSNLTAFGSTTAVDWSRSVSRLYTLSASYNMQRTTFDQPSLDQTFQSAGMRLTRRLTRSVSLRLGYMYQLVDSAMAPGAFGRNHDLDLGVDYTRALSGAGRTTVSFRSGFSVTPQAQGTAFNPTGSAQLARRIGRTWSARVGVSRDVQPLEGFTRPVLSNAVTSTVTGALGRRARVSSSAGFITGTVGLDSAGGNSFSTWTGTAALHVILTRRSAFETQYSWYGYRFGPSVLLAPGLATELSRNSLRVGISWRAPLLGHLRETP